MIQVREMISMTYYNRTNTCDNIKDNGEICGNSFHGKAFKEYDEEYNWTGNWLCPKCYYIDYNEKNLKSLWRIGLLDPLSPVGKGFIGQQIVAKTYEVEDCNLKMDNFNFYVDLAKIGKYGYCEVKIATFNKRNGKWEFEGIDPEHFDSLFIVCMDKNEFWKNVERVYIIPVEYIISSHITIYENTSTKLSKWEKFRIDHKPFDKIYHNMKLENCKILKKK